MEFEKQSCTIKVDNIESGFENKHHCFKKHGELFPSSIRCIICGPSNCGKTNLMITLLTNPNGLRFKNVYVYSKTLYQNKYKLLQEILSPIVGINYFQYPDNVNIVSPENAMSNSIFIFDDIACDPQDCMRNYFSMGRHKQIEPFCLIQSYARVGKHLIRDNINFLVLFKQDDLNLRHVYNDHVNTDMTFANFKALCAECWKDKFGFLVIDKDSDFNNGRYRKGFDQFLKSI